MQCPDSYMIRPCFLELRIEYNIDWIMLLLDIGMIDDISSVVLMFLIFQFPKSENSY